MVDFINNNHLLCFQVKLKTLYPTQQRCGRYLAALFIITSGPLIYSKTNSKFTSEGFFISDLLECEELPQEVSHLVSLAWNLFNEQDDFSLEAWLEESTDASISIAKQAIDIKTNGVGDWIE